MAVIRNGVKILLLSLYVVNCQENRQGYNHQEDHHQKSHQDDHSQKSHQKDEGRYLNAGYKSHLETRYSWSYADFQYPSETAKLIGVQMGTYIPDNIVILDSDLWIDGSKKRYFVSTPRFKPGTPSTVSEIIGKNSEGPLLKPFPDWESQTLADCQGPVSVYRIHIDKCGRLWVLDTGRINTFVSATRACQPKVSIYDLRDNDRLIDRYEFPNGVATMTSNLATLVTDIHGSDCRNTFAYIADTNAYGLVVYDFARRNSWRVDHAFFYPFPTHGTMTISGVTFDLMDGVFGIALGPETNAGHRLLYFHALASFREGWVSTQVLKNYTTYPTSDARNAFTLSEEARPSQSSLEVVTDDGILIFTLMSQNSLACWNTKTPYKKENIHVILQDNDRLQFVSGMKLIGDILLVTSSQLQNYIAGKSVSSDIKYRILEGSASELVRNSPCYNRYG